MLQIDSRRLRSQSSPARPSTSAKAEERRAPSSKSAGPLGCRYDHLREPQPRPRKPSDLHGGEHG